MESFLHGIRSVTFDVGYTILFPARPVGEIYTGILNQYGVHLTPDLVNQLFFESWQNFLHTHTGLVYGTTHEEAMMAWQVILENMLIKAGLNPAQLPLNQMANELYDFFSEPAAWRENPHWLKMLTFCREMEMTVGFLSNWDLRLATLLERMALSRKVDFQIISAECGLEKPDPRIFELAAKTAGTPIHQLLHVGDTWRDDVEGVLSAGGRALYLNTHQKPVPENISEDVMVIDCFSQLF